jgi:hypothetical protein
LAQALLDSAHYKESGSAKVAETALSDSIPCGADGNLFSIYLQLGCISNEHGRISIGQFLGDEPYPVNLVDCWLARCLAAKFLEQDVRRYAENVKSPSKLGGITFRRTTDELIQLALDLWKLYSAGYTNPIEEFFPTFELYDVRGDSTHLEEKHRMPTDIAVCVSLVIGRGDASLATVCRMLEPIPVFAEVAQFWEDDELFARWTEKSAQWYLEYCPKNYSKLEIFANVAPDVLLPSWITALDRFRQVKNGRPSCLGEHELFDISKAVFDGAKAQKHPRLPSLVKAEEYYEELFGLEPFNPLPFWEEFLERE